MLKQGSFIRGLVFRRSLAFLFILILLTTPTWIGSVFTTSAQDQEPFDIAEIWDLEEMKDPLTLNAEIMTFPIRKVTLGVSLDVFEVMFDSIDRGDGPIRVHGFVAVPTGQALRTMPGVVYGHGAGDEADEEIARQLAASFRAVAISFSGPGQGLSTGARSTAQHWLNTVPDIRDSWLYQYVYSALRAVTYLTTLPEVDPQRVGMTGISAGGLMTLIANGIDDRLAAAFVMSATGDLDRSLEAGSWFLTFPLGQAGLSADSPEARAFAQYLDPLVYADRQRAPVMLINGAQDEFFPITTTRSTYEAIRAPEKRLEVIYDWDHGYFGGSSRLYDSYNNTLNGVTRLLGDAEAWFDWHLSGGEALPPTPQLSVEQQAGMAVFTVPAAFAQGAREVRLIYSVDDAWTFNRVSMRRQLNGSYRASLPLDASKLVYFVEVQWRSSIYLTSVPEFPEGFIPRIRPIT